MEISTAWFIFLRFSQEASLAWFDFSRECRPIHLIPCHEQCTEPFRIWSDRPLVPHVPPLKRRTKQWVSTVKQDRIGTKNVESNVLKCMTVLNCTSLLNLWSPTRIISTRESNSNPLWHMHKNLKKIPINDQFWRCYKKGCGFTGEDRATSFYRHTAFIEVRTVKSLKGTVSNAYLLPARIFAMFPLLLVAKTSLSSHTI